MATSAESRVRKIILNSTNARPKSVLLKLKDTFVIRNQADVYFIDYKNWYGMGNKYKVPYGHYITMITNFISDYKLFSESILHNYKPCFDFMLNSAFNIYRHIWYVLLIKVKGKVLVIWLIKSGSTWLIFYGLSKYRNFVLQTS
jgi:hypothetical protein